MKSEYDETANYLTEMRQASCFILTSSQKEAFLPELNPNKYEEKLLQQYYKEFTGDDSAETGKVMMEGIRILFENIKKLEPGNVILLMIS